MKKFKNLQKLHTSLQTHIALAERVSEPTKQSSFHRRVFMEHSLVDGTASDVEGSSGLAVFVNAEFHCRST